MSRLVDRMARFQEPGDSYLTPDLSDCDVLDYWYGRMSGQTYVTIRVAHTASAIDLPIADLEIAGEAAGGDPQ